MVESVVKIFATLSPIPGFMQWLLSKLASQIKLAEAETEEAKLLDMGSGSAFRESLLLQDEEKIILESFTYVFLSLNRICMNELVIWKSF